jgi:Monooxygenase af470-like
VAVWRDYWKRVGTSTRTGIWHETYLVRAGEYEAIYGNMPPSGLGKAGRLVPLADAKTARDRFRAAASGAVRQSD